MDFAKKVGINLSTLKSIENDHQQATTVENLDKCAAQLDLTVDDIILRGREIDPANCFIFKRSDPPIIKGIRKRKRFPEEWHQSIRLRFKSFDLTPISPPVITKKDFFFCRINLPPKHGLEKLNLGIHNRVVGFVSGGFNIKIVYANKEVGTLTTHQGFALDGHFPHSIINDDEDNAAVIYLVTKLPHFENVRISNDLLTHRNIPINIAQGIHRLRVSRSDRPERLISVKHLSDLTESLNYEQVAKLMRTKKGSSVIYWEKIEDLLAGTGISMEDFLQWCHGAEKSPFSMATAAARAMIDYSTHHGVKIYSSIPPQNNNEFFCGEVLMEAKGGIAQKSWERKDNAMIALYVEEGELEVTVGKSRSALTLLKGESIYFDGSLGYIFRNPAEKQAKGLFATHPAIQF
jgi:DNA-binding Xre family transcriptional regulator